MGQTNYEWDRFWYPVEKGGTVRFDQDGFLVDPVSPFRSILNPALVRLYEFADVGCLVLLGEPGIGKSTTLDQFSKDLSQIAPHQGNHSTATHNLSIFSSEHLLIQRVFESAEFKKWRDGNFKLVLTLDSFDECRIRIDTLCQLLIDQLKSEPVDRLALRLVSRSAEWPRSMGDGLKSIWGDDNVGFFQLAPLRKCDIESAARAHRVNPIDFLNEVIRASAVAFASKPVTLPFLIDNYRQHGALPAQKNELYRTGCLQLCGEPSSVRRESQLLRGKLSKDQRIAIAGRIAAITMLCNRVGVRLDDDFADASDGTIAIHELGGGQESANSTQFNVTESAIREVLDTGLFSVKAEGCVGFSHQTYAEFLAAKYLIDHRVPLDQQLRLITHQNHNSTRAIPQLHDTAAWLAGMSNEVFDSILEFDPAVLLKSDVDALDDSQRSRLLESLLRHHDQEKLFDSDWQRRRSYSKLRHNGIETVLSAYISDQSRNTVVRRVAIDIAEACSITELANLLTDVVMNIDDDHHIRTQAAHALIRVGNDETRERLKSLLSTKLIDPGDELRGCILEILWPSAITLNEVLESIKGPRQGNLIGSFVRFVRYTLPESLTNRHRSQILEWGRNLDWSNQGVSELIGMVEDVFVKSIDFLDDEKVIEAFSSMLADIITFHRHFQSTSGLNSNCSIVNAAHRRSVLNRVICIVSVDQGIAAIAFSKPSLVYSEDIDWLCARLDRDPDLDTRIRIATLLRSYLFEMTSDQIDSVLGSCEREPEIGHVFANMLSPITLDSELAKCLRSARSMDRTKKKATDSDEQRIASNSKISGILDTPNLSALERWNSLVAELLAYPINTNSSVWFLLDLRQTYGWTNADETLRHRIVDAAKKVIVAGNPFGDEWLGSNDLYFSHEAGLKAFALLFTDDQPFLASLEPEVWRNWSPILVGCFSGSNDPDPIREGLLRLAYGHATSQIVDAVRRIASLEKKRDSGGCIFVVRKVLPTLGKEIAEFYSGMLADDELSEFAMFELLVTLLNSQIESARRYSCSLLDPSSQESPTNSKRRLVVCLALMTVGDKVSWPMIWNQIQQNEEFGRQLIERFAVRSVHKDFFRALDETECEDLLSWLEDKFPSSEDPAIYEFHEITTREHIGYFRQHLLNALSSRASIASVKSLQRLAAAHPGLSWLKWSSIDTEEAMLAKTWQPPNPKDAIEVIFDAEKRIVETGQQLFEVVLESLDRLKSELRGLTPGLQFLWDKSKDGTFRPKDENSLSDYVAIHLRKDLIGRGLILNREVEIARWNAKGQGDRTDILVETTPKSASGEYGTSVIRLVIEVKGCWHKKLQTAIESQLRDQYMNTIQCTRGIYLIGWYKCDGWADDYRRNDVIYETIEDAQTDLIARAETACLGRPIVIAPFVLDLRIR